MAGKGFLADLTMKIGADVADLKRGLSQATAGVKGFAGKAKVAGKQFKTSMTSSMGVMGSAINPQLAMFSSMLTQGLGAMKALTVGTNLFKIALAATGIGLLIIALGSLVAYFTSTEEGMEMVTKATEGIKAVFTKLTDIAADIGKMLVWAFQNPQEALQNLWDKVKNFGKEVIGNLIKGIGLLGSALMKAFKGDFEDAIDDAKEGLAAIYQVDIAKKAIKAIGSAIKKNIVEPFKEGVKVGEQIIDNADAEIIRARKLGKLEQLRGLYRKQAREIDVTPEEELAAFMKELEVTRQIGVLTAQAIKDKITLLEAQHALGNNTKADNKELADLYLEQGNILGSNFRKEKEVLMMISTAKNKQIAAEKKLNALKIEFLDGGITEKSIQTDKDALKDKFNNLEDHLKDMQDLRDEAAEELEEKAKEAADRNQSIADNANQMINKVLHEGIISSAKAVADAINGIEKGNISFGDKILMLVAQFAIDFGALLIAAAIASEAFKESLASNPWIAAAAGIALIIAGNLAKNALANRADGMANGGIASGGLTMVGERGRELVNLPQGSRVMSHPDTMSMLGGRGAQVMIPDLRIRGEDIWIAFTEADRKLNNTR